MNWNVVFLIVLICVVFNVQAKQSVFIFNSEKVTVKQGENETINQAVNRAKELLSINAISKTPKFVSLNTSYDSSSDEIVERGLIAQGANLSIHNVKHSVRLLSDAMLVDVEADVKVDVSVMLEKLQSEKREKLMMSVIDDLHREQRELELVLDRIQRKSTITQAESLVVKSYYNKLNQTFSIVPGETIKKKLQVDLNGMSEKEVIKADVIKAYELFVFPFIKNAKITHEIIDITEMEHEVADIKVRVSIDRKVDYTDMFIPNIKNGYRLEDCEAFFNNCKWLLDHEHSIWFVPSVPKTRWTVDTILKPRFCGRSIYEFLPLKGQDSLGNKAAEKNVRCGSSFQWRTSFLASSIDMTNLWQKEIDHKEVYSDALRELSKRSFWLRIDVGREAFHLNLSNLMVNELTFSVYQPISWLNDGIKITTSVREEIYNVNNSSWSDINGNFLRYQNREIYFY
ncbi:hypothetical protein [Shewanella sp. UCD-KL12]|uniref:hypothetical protein n=1 Tax=Shewanella sp. UCD-KL12 TaxID=1917163 RepID=UPI000970F898|nr:hypothetical protein [Shewanella sp. UCD-KL12]